MKGIISCQASITLSCPAIQPNRHASGGKTMLEWEGGTARDKAFTEAACLEQFFRGMS